MSPVMKTDAGSDSETRPVPIIDVSCPPLTPPPPPMSSRRPSSTTPPLLPPSGVAVKVSLRIRPVPPTTSYPARQVVQVHPTDTQTVLVDGRKSFTFDRVFGPEHDQDDVYDASVKTLVDGFLEGYNATVLAYGQSGTGKTYTMGSASPYTLNGSKPTDISPHDGIIPRAVRDIFACIEQHHNPVESGMRVSARYQITVSLIEIHNEDLLDLLPNPPSKNVTIREDPRGSIYWAGATERVVASADEALSLLAAGLAYRQTSATNLNQTSSRSHAIFSLQLRQHQWIAAAGEPGGAAAASPAFSPVAEPLGGDYQTVVSKFHFVDLAGSERLKRTNAVGGRQREGSMINLGLLALGNVINALGGENPVPGSYQTGSAHHIPYRDSKLTRVLQDSLGGNSQTVMIACISPIEADLGETLNTLKWANRGRNIRNAAVVNHEYHTQSEVKALQNEVARLKTELVSEGTFTSSSSDVARLVEENNRLKQQLSASAERDKALQQRNDYLANELALVQSESVMMRIHAASPTPSTADDDNTITTSHQSVEGARSPEPPRAAGEATSPTTGSLLPVPKRHRVRPRSVGSADIVNDLLPSPFLTTPPDSPTLSRNTPSSSTQSSSAISSQPSHQKLRLELRETTLAARQYLSQIDALHNVLQSRDAAIEGLNKTVEELKTMNAGAEDYIAGLESQVERHAEIAETVEKLERELETERAAAAAGAGTTDSLSQDFSSTNQNEDMAVRDAQVQAEALWAKLLDQETQTAELLMSEDDHRSSVRDIKDQLRSIPQHPPVGATLVPAPSVQHTPDVVAQLQTTIKNLEAQLAEKSAQHDNATGLLAALEAELEQYETEVKALRDGLVVEHASRTTEETRFLAGEQRVRDLTEKDQANTAQIAELTARIESATAEQGRLAQANDALIQRVQELQGAAAGHEDKVRELNTVVATHWAEKEDLSAKHVELQQSHDSHVAEKATLTARIEELLSTVQRHESTARDLNSLVDTHRAEKEELAGKHAELQERHVADKVALEARVEQLQNDIRAHESTTRDLNSLADTHRTEKEELAGRHAELQQEKDALAARIEELQNAMQGHESTTRDLSTLVDTHRSESENLAAKHEELQQLHDSHVAEKAVLAVRVEELLQTVQGHETATRELRAEKEELIGKHEELQKLHDSHVAEKASLAARVEELQKAVVSHEATARELVDTHTADKEGLAGRHAELQQQHESLAQENTALVARLEELESTAKGHADSVRELNALVDSHRTDKQHLEAKLLETSAASQALLAKVEAREKAYLAEKEALAAQILAHETTHRDLTSQLDTHKAEKERHLQDFEKREAERVAQLERVRQQLEEVHTSVVPDLQQRAERAAEERDSHKTRLETLHGKLTAVLGLEQAYEADLLADAVEQKLREAQSVQSRDLDTSTSMVQTLEQELGELRAQVSQLTARNSELESGIAASSGQSEAQQAEVQALQAELAARKVEMGESVSQRGILETTLAKMKGRARCAYRGSVGGIGAPAERSWRGRDPHERSHHPAWCSVDSDCGSHGGSRGKGR
ncbi:hypothetical protein DFJ77DRAFT_55159 [Powellomyces hirtus]|nr:hypothetical protein DFJ77DRAFT_55159 [Powellomyces hirtus]